MSVRAASASVPRSRASVEGLGGRELVGLVETAGDERAGGAIGPHPRREPRDAQLVDELLHPRTRGVSAREVTDLEQRLLAQHLGAVGHLAIAHLLCQRLDRGDLAQPLGRRLARREGGPRLRVERDQPNPVVSHPLCHGQGLVTVDPALEAQRGEVALDGQAGQQPHALARCRRGPTPSRASSISAIRSWLALADDANPPASRPSPTTARAKRSPSPTARASATARSNTAFVATLPTRQWAWPSRTRRSSRVVGSGSSDWVSTSRARSRYATASS